MPDRATIGSHDEHPREPRAPKGGPALPSRRRPRTSRTCRSRARSRSRSSARCSRTPVSSESTRPLQRRCRTCRSSRAPTSTSPTAGRRRSRYIEQRMERPLVAKDVVRFVGDIVAVVVSRGPRDGRRRRRARGGRLRPAARSSSTWSRRRRTRCCSSRSRDERRRPRRLAWSTTTRSSRAARSSSRTRSCSQRMAGVPARGALGGRRGRRRRPRDGWLSTQVPHRDHDRPRGDARARARSGARRSAPDVGGGFGAKSASSVEGVLVVWLARQLGPPVRWTETRTENMLALPHGRGQRLEFTLGGTRDGKRARLPARHPRGRRCVPGGRRLPAEPDRRSWRAGCTRSRGSRSKRVSVVTNTTPMTTIRGAGRPEAAQAIERVVDLFAAEIGMDPAEVRRKNFIAKDAFPYTTAPARRTTRATTRARSTSCSRSAGYDELRTEQRRRRDEGGTRRARASGIGAYVEITNPVGEEEFGEVEITDDGGAIVHTGSLSARPGPRDDVRDDRRRAARAADRARSRSSRATPTTCPGAPARSGRSRRRSAASPRGGPPTRWSSARRRSRPTTSRRAPPTSSSTTATGRFHVAGTPQPALSWAELAARAGADGRLDELKARTTSRRRRRSRSVSTSRSSRSTSRPGRSSSQRLVAVDDAGTLVNPLIAEGQVHGGIARASRRRSSRRSCTTRTETRSRARSSATRSRPPRSCPRWSASRWRRRRPPTRSARRESASRGPSARRPPSRTPCSTRWRPYGVRHVDLPCNGENVWRALQEANA